MWIISRVLIGIVVLSLLEYYFTKKLNGIFKILYPGYSSKKKSWLFFVFLAMLNLYPAILIFNAVYAALTKESVAFPQNIYADYFLLYPFWILILIILQVSVLFVFVDLPLSVWALIRRNKKDQLGRIKIKIFLALIIFFSIYVPARVIYDYHSVDITQINYNKKDLPKDLDGFKIAFISDVQADRYTDEKRLQKYIDQINGQKPDLVLIAGDVITSSPEYIKTAGIYIGKIKSVFGTFSCVGDHDNWAYRKDFVRSLREVKSSLSENNVRMLDNDLHYISLDSSTIGVSFITHNYVTNISAVTLRNISASNNADFKIFLTHQPQKFLIDQSVKDNYDLFLAGHTHGGQITLLFPFIQLTPTLFETPYIKGEFRFKHTLAVICGGLGMSLAPVRYNSTPEIIFITLKRN